MNEADEQPTVEEPSEQGPRPSPGMLLRQARDGQGLSVTEVASRLKLRRELIEQLEADDFGGSVEGTFVRGYLRAYAKLLQLNEADIIAAYEALGVTERPVEQMQSFSRKTSMASQDNKLMLLTWVIVAIFVTSALVFGWQKLQEPGPNGPSAMANGMPDAESEPAATQQAVTGEQDTREAAEETAAGRIDPAEVVAEQAQEPDPAADQHVPGIDEFTAVLDEPLAAPSPEEAAAVVAEAGVAELAPEMTEDNSTDHSTAAEESSTEEQSTAEPETESTGDPQAATSEQTANVSRPEEEELPEAELVLRFAADSWIRIEDASGTTLAYGVQAAGEQLALDGIPPYELILGSPDSVDVFYGGEEVDMTEFRGSRSSRLTLPEQE